jgi:NAD(P)-dependent dehydrogenase (short-subunit alcohol dehydrogenase family)
MMIGPQGRERTFVMDALHGKIMLITGATDGLGRRVAEDLAALGATVLLHGRNPAKGEAALKEIRNRTGNEQLRYYNADFAALEEVRRMAAQVATDQERLDVLVNNAGIGAGAHGGQHRELSRDGFELRLAVNYLAPYLLTRLLLPLLRRTAERHGEVRIVHVASAAQQAIDFDDPQLEHGYSGMRAYAQSKLAQILFTFDLAQELEGSGVLTTALHPASLMDTNMVREWFGRPRTTVTEGARALERLILSSDVHGVSGQYFEGERRGTPDPQAWDLAARRRLRELSESWIAAAGEGAP